MSKADNAKELFESGCNCCQAVFCAFADKFGIDDEMATLNVSDYRSKVENTTVLLTVPVFDDMLKDIDTSADTQYFVGSTPKPEDFRAPMTMPDFNLPPLREYVRLDYVDLQSIAKDADKLTIGKYAHKTGLGILPELFWEKAEVFCQPERLARN